MEEEVSAGVLLADGAEKDGPAGSGGATVRLCADVGTAAAALGSTDSAGSNDGSLILLTGSAKWWDRQRLDSGTVCCHAAQQVDFTAMRAEAVESVRCSNGTVPAGSDVKLA